MNTSKQVNIMIGLLMLFLLGTLLYFLWDSVRADDATDRQLMDNTDRGASLFALNCRSCHGLTGMGTIENGSLPGAPLNIDSNRPPKATSAQLDGPTGIRARFTDTIHCGRVGTRMPAWSQAQGGSLNDFQIEQLVTLITGDVSEEGWKHALEVASFGDHLNPGDRFAPQKHILEGISATATAIKVNEAHGPKAGDLLRIDDDPLDEVYEIVEVVDAPASSVLVDDITSGATEFELQVAFIFQDGDQITVEDERMTITDAPAVTTLTADVTATATSIELQSTAGIAKGEVLGLESEKVTVVDVSGTTVVVERAALETEATGHKADVGVIESSKKIAVERGQAGTTARNHRAKTPVLEIGDTIEVKRAAFQTTAAEHDAGVEIFAGPIPPGDTITGASGTPPCGQKPAPAAVTPGPPVSVSGAVAVSMGDNFFDIDGQQNPNLQAAAGQPVTFNLTNGGTAIHDMRFAGPDGQYQTADDVVSDPDVVPGGATATLTVNLPAGTSPFRCDFHPTEMKGEITVQ